MRAQPYQISGTPQSIKKKRHPQRMSRRKFTFQSNDAILSHYDFVDVATHQFVERPYKLLFVGIVVLEVDGYQQLVVSLTSLSSTISS